MSALKTIFKGAVMMLSTIGALLVMQVPPGPIWRPILGLTILMLASAYYYND